MHTIVSTPINMRLYFRYCLMIIESQMSRIHL